MLRNLFSESNTVCAFFVTLFFANSGTHRKNRTASFETVRFLERKAKLLILALSCRLRLLLTLYAGLFVMLSFTEFGKNTRLHALSLKTTKRAVKSFIFFYSDFCHFLYPSLRFAKRPKSHNFQSIIPEKILFVKRFYEKIRRKRKIYTASSPNTAIFAAVSVFLSSSVTVMTPTPPGTGVM